MALKDNIICRIANVTRRKNLRRLDPFLRFLHNPDNRKKHSIKRTIHLKDCGLFDIDTSSYLEWTLFFYGQYEPFTQKIIKTFVKKGDVVLDIGANIGIHSCTLAHAVGPNGCVYSFEPHPKIFNKLVTNVSLNKFSWVYPEKIALSDSTGVAQLHGFGDNDGNEGTSSLEERAVGLENVFDVKTMTLDDFVASRKLQKINALKMDVEGHELHVFKGAVETIRTFRPLIIFEDSKKEIINSGSQIRKLLEKLSYRLYEIKYDHLTEMNDEGTKNYNFLALPLQCFSGSKEQREQE